MIGQTISHYRVLAPLGSGGMGVVYEAEDVRLGRKVAIKLLSEEVCANPEHVQRFLREARVISSLNHPHICTLHDIGETGCQQYMVMELLEGQPLKARIARGPLPMDEVLELGAQMADALEAAHAQGVVHRDIKPANLFITRRGHLKVLDFGVAKLSEVARGPGDLDTTRAPTDQLTTLGTAIGTIAYMSPEQARGQDIDARSDIFSAGIVLYEMATGQLPFPGATAAVVFEGLLTKSPPPPSALAAGAPPEFDRIVARALAKDRAARYRDAAELRTDLRRLAGVSRAGASAPAKVAEPEGSVLPTRPARRWAWIAAPLAAAAVAAGVFVYRSVTTPALTAQDPVVLSAMVNRTGDAMFDDTLGEALAIQLRQSPFLKVVSDQQVQSTLRLMGRDPSTAITPEIGRDLCQRVGGRALLGGSIASLGRSYLLTLNAQDCVSGSVLAEAQQQADSKESVLKALGAAVATFREHLGESLASVQRYDAKVEEATTASLEALKAYSQGVRARQVSGDFDSVPFFRRAIDLDPEFALAYARLGTVYSNLRQADEAKKMSTRAFELRGRVSEAERFYIEARYHTTVEVDLQKAIESYRLLLATYPDDYTGLANLGLLLKQQGRVDEALTHQEHATRVAPDQPLGWSNLGDTYVQLQRFDDARRAFESALKIQDSSGARGGIFSVALATGDRDLEQAQVEAMRGRRDEVEFIGGRARAAMYRGRFAEASTLLAEWQQRMAEASRVAGTGEGIAGHAINEALVGLTAAARARVDAADDEGLLNSATLDEQVVLAAVSGDAAAGRALRSKVTAEIINAPNANPTVARVMRALVALAEGTPADASAVLEPVAFEASRADEITIWVLAQLWQQRWAEAAKGLTFLDQQRRRTDITAFPAFVLVSLGRAHAALGDAAAARAAYQAFFDLWREADADVPLLVQAREEYGKLGS